MSLITTLGVVAVGAINGILIAVALALARFIRQAARPRDEVLGRVEGLPGFHSIERHGAAAKTFPGLDCSDSTPHWYSSTLTILSNAHWARPMQAEKT